MIQDFLS